MKANELSKLQRVQFVLDKKLVQGLVVGNKRKRVVIMKDHGNGDWRPVFIPIGLLDHINFQHAVKLFMPVYNPIMQNILEQAREGRIDD